jgi:hypothetical protein
MSETENFTSYSKLSKEVADCRRNGEQTPTLTFATKDAKTYTLKVDILQ